MSKQRKQGRASVKRPFCTDTFINHCLTDLSPYLDVKELRDCLHSNPDSFRDMISEKVQIAESNLAVGDLYGYTALRQIEAFCKKVPDWRGIGPEERHRRSLDKFFKSEVTCKVTNKRLRWYLDRQLTRPRIESQILSEASLFIQEVLGSLSSQVYSRILDGAGHGNGSTFGCKRPEDKNLVLKLKDNLTITRGAVRHFAHYCARNPGWINSDPDFVHKVSLVNGNRVIDVPKSWDINRTIAVEPSLNVFLQKGVDGFIKGRLRRYGVDLSNQGANSDIAKRGSVEGGFSTVDLSSASDTISYELVKFLVPNEWFELLDNLRSPSYTLDRGLTWRQYEKFSSMGNATTFPVETLIFYAIARACTVHANGDVNSLRTYGDDIVVPTNALCLLTQVLRFAGFTVNRDKSYAFGPFRETCGTDFVSGVDVRPVYVRKLPRSPSEIYNLHNRILLNCKFRLRRCEVYLKSLLKGAHVGPLHPGLTWISQYLDKRYRLEDSIELSSYLIGDPPDGGAYSHDLHTVTYTVPILRVKPKMTLRSLVGSVFHYRAFLLGMPGDHIPSASSFSVRQCNTVFSDWRVTDTVLREGGDFR